MMALSCSKSEHWASTVHFNILLVPIFQ